MANPSALRTASAVEAPSSLSGVLDGLDENVNRDSAEAGVRLGVVLNAAGRRSYGALLAVIGLFAMSPATIVPGMTVFTALVIFAVALQMALGRQRPWLPRRLLAVKVPRRALFAAVDRARPAVQRIDGVWLRPRFEFLLAPPFMTLVALCVAAAALVTLPLSIVPFAPFAPSLAVVLFGLGMLARDGLWLSLGVGVVGGAGWLAAPVLTALLPV